MTQAAPLSRGTEIEALRGSLERTISGVTADTLIIARDTALRLAQHYAGLGLTEREAALREFSTVLGEMRGFDA